MWASQIRRLKEAMNQSEGGLREKNEQVGFFISISSIKTNFIIDLMIIHTFWT